MASKREPSPSLRMRKIALVICEGETEVSYINLLKSWYKSPIRIISHITNLVEMLSSDARQSIESGKGV